MPNTVTRGAFLALAFFFTWTGQAAQAPKLIPSAQVNPKTHTITWTLKNTNNVPAVTWMLRLEQFDQDSHLIQGVNFGEEYVYALAYPDDPDETETLQRDWIQPGQTITRPAKAKPNAAYARLTVLAVIYADRRAEGNEKEIKMLFDGRARMAKELADTAASPQANAREIANLPHGIKSTTMARAQALEAQSRRAQ